MEMDNATKPCASSFQIAADTARNTFEITVSDDGSQFIAIIKYCLHFYAKESCVYYFRKFMIPIVGPSFSNI